jgi:hypothetical protein
MKPLQPTSLDHYCRLHAIAMVDPDSPIDVSEINNSCIRAMYARGLIEYRYITVNDAKTRHILFTELGLKYGCEKMAQAHVPKGTKTPRNRVWVRAQFDLTDEDYETAFNIAGELIEANEFAPTLRDCLNIHDKAKDGDYSLFYQFYGIPAVKETASLESMAQSLQDMRGMIADLMDENRKLREQLQNTPQSTDKPVSKGLQPVSGSTQGKVPNQLVVPQFEVPKYEDDEDDTEDLLVVKKDLDAGKRATQNFLSSLMSLTDENNKPPVNPKAFSGRQRRGMERDNNV